MLNAILVVVTDGAPRNLADASRLGFAGAADYAAARRNELLHALAFAGLGEDRLVMLGLPDQESAFHLSAICRSLGDLFRAERPEIVITHAYEGGHPDHDAVALAVHGACALPGQEGAAPALVEIPLYRAAGREWARQCFEPWRHAPALSLRLSAPEEALKRKMMVAHATQSATLAGFGTAVEHFRAAPPYDFTELPNGGELLYERYQWGMTGARWQSLARQALSDLSRAPVR